MEQCIGVIFCHDLIKEALGTVLAILPASTLLRLRSEGFRVRVLEFSVQGWGSGFGFISGLEGLVSLVLWL